ncbi:olfactory receptor 6E1-like [Alligator mississippiensis]|uniref:olfactory receptor 6E1-like n=1 Tax=Alligator mississippiensis TaxID=8496 RepID=UPI002877E31A|nr:olfactory receptor 6E1-like [Alligator mississippiensis]
MANRTRVTEFILIGFSLSPQTEIILFFLFLMFYLVTVSGNLLIITITLISHRLHAPMYFFLRNFSVMEILFTSITVPKLLAGLLFHSKTISYHARMAQCFFYFFVGVTEFIFLAIMSFDRYVAICNPLRYTTIMNNRVCIQLLLAAWSGSFFPIFFSALFFLQVPFCGPNVVNHFFCDSIALEKIACTDTHPVELMNLILASLLLCGSLVVTTVSYIHIFITVLRIPTAKGRQKAFSTCASHITVVSLTYGTHIFMHVQSTETSSLDLNKAVALMTTVVTPSLNPFIYTLRNEAVKQALRETIIQKKRTS